MPMTVEFVIKKDDLIPSITAYLVDHLNDPVDLTTALSVRFIMRAKSATANKVDAAATIVTPSTGEVRYDWTQPDTNTSGIFEGEWEVLWPGNKPETYPNWRHIVIRVHPDLGGVV